VTSLALSAGAEKAARRARRRPWFPPRLLLPLAAIHPRYSPPRSLRYPVLLRFFSLLSPLPFSFLLLFLSSLLFFLCPLTLTHSGAVYFLSSDGFFCPHLFLSLLVPPLVSLQVFKRIRAFKLPAAGLACVSPPTITVCAVQLTVWWCT